MGAITYQRQVYQSSFYLDANALLVLPKSWCYCLCLSAEQVSG